MTTPHDQALHDLAVVVRSIARHVGLGNDSKAITDAYSRVLVLAAELPADLDEPPLDRRDVYEIAAERVAELPAADPDGWPVSRGRIEHERVAVMTDAEAAEFHAADVSPWPQGQPSTEPT